MKFSVVTISFNQGAYLERAIESVLMQSGVEVEYIIVDPGSTDHSREIICKYREAFAKIILEKDLGPADGLNKGFRSATGDIFCYLNSDDEYEKDAFARVRQFFQHHLDVDVACGHAWIVDQHSRRIRRVWSNHFSPVMFAYSAALEIQPSTFFRAPAFKRTQGFNVNNRIAWDSELLADLALTGANIEIIDEFLSLYRIHEQSITGSGLHRERSLKAFRDRFAKLMGRQWRATDEIISILLRIIRHVQHPPGFFERLLRGKISGLAKDRSSH